MALGTRRAEKAAWRRTGGLLTDKAVIRHLSQEEHVWVERRRSRRQQMSPRGTHLKWSCNATLKSKASPRSPKPIPIKARRPRYGGEETHQSHTFKGSGSTQKSLQTPRTVSIFNADHEVPAGVSHTLHSCARKLVHWGLCKELPCKYREREVSWGAPASLVLSGTTRTFLLGSMPDQESLLQEPTNLFLLEMMPA